MESRRRRGSSTQVMSIPAWGMDGMGAEDGWGLVKTACGSAGGGVVTDDGVSVAADEDEGGIMHPASATNDAW